MAVPGSNPAPDGQTSHHIRYLPLPAATQPFSRPFPPDMHCYENQLCDRLKFADILSNEERTAQGQPGSQECRLEADTLPGDCYRDAGICFQLIKRMLSLKQKAMRLAFLSLALLVQSFGSGAQQYKTELFNELQGLPSNFVFCTLRDSRGFLWIGTDNGLARFDGRNMITYSLNDGLPSLEVDAIREDRNGDLWINTRGGLCCYDGRKFHTFHVVPKNDVAYIIDFAYNRQGKLEFNINGHFFELDHRKPVSIPDRRVKKQRFRSYLALPNGDDIVITDSVHTYYVSASGAVKEIHRFHNKPGGLFLNNDTAYVFNRLGLFRVDSTGATPVILLKDSTNMVLKAVIDPYHVAWLSVIGVGILAHDFKTGGEQWIDKKNSPLGYFSSSLLADEKYGIWASSMNGLGRITRSPVSFTEKATGPDGKEVTRVFANRSHIFTVTRDHLFIRPVNSDGQTSIPLAIPDTDTNNIESLAEDNQGNVWTFYYNGQLLKYDRQTGRAVFRKDLECTGHASIIWNNPRAALYVPQPKNLLRFRNDGATDTIYPRKSWFGPKQIVADSSGDLWITNSRKRLWRCHNDTIIELTHSADLPDAQIYSLAFSNNELWLGTRGRGLYRYSFQPGGLKLQRQYTIKDGLSTDFVMSIAIASDKTIWLVTTAGINQLINIRGRELILPRVHLTAAGGSFSYASLSEDEDLNIRCITAKGLLTIKPSMFQGIRPPQKVHILSVSSPNGSVEDSSGTDFFHLPRNASFPSNISDLTFSFTVSNLYASAVTYKYRLEGTDEHWITGNAGTANYYNLPSGSYVFTVRAVDENGIESSPASFAFEILPPFWKTWWFRSLAILSVIAVIFYVVKRREASIRKENTIALKFGELRMQALRAQMNPHFIFNTLNSIQSFVLEHRTEDASRYLTKFARLIRLVLDKSSEDSISLEDEIRMLTYYIDLEKMRFNDRFDYKLNVDPALDASLHIPSFMLQPHIENAILHGLQPLKDPGLLTISFRLHGDDNIECIITDNGIGRAAAKQRKEGSLHRHQSKGLTIIGQRMDILQGQKNKEVSLNVEDLLSDKGDAAGTLIRIIIPIL
jgi:ligand-binding sensor domain-containing protein